MIGKIIIIVKICPYVKPIALLKVLIPMNQRWNAIAK